MILETDPQIVAARVTMRGADSEVPIAEQVRPAITIRSSYSALAAAAAAAAAA